ncbi:uncharacterized protein LOC106168664 [Lingula anatina]|uniref:Uncharacterized protein LOC106168664 n=1 Tax=Lingula anatina TaxID=7574 RepID=A0A1S3IZ57_LINAN|nr:uncharacterized protein LOC106168664 [Lingula anatina]|eukprot:XP_013403271.1 uncharacterized protein LOC106168664 [Lingula anatina]
MGYQNSTFLLAVYGCIDTASRKILWLKVWVTNSDLLRVGRWYLDYLYETKTIAVYLRMDKGTETGKMATMHTFLRSHHGDLDETTDSVIYGPSTSNQIERWWRELHERLEKFFKMNLCWLKDNGHYDPKSEQHRMLLAYIMIPLLQRELDTFKDCVWNSHRIRAQKDTVLPSGIPDHIHNFPEEYSLEQCELPVTNEQLREVAEISGVLDVSDDFLEPDFRRRCERILPDIHEIEAKDFWRAYLYLKDNFNA